MRAKNVVLSIEEVRPLPSSIGRYVLLRRLPDSITGEAYLAIDAEVGLVDVHLLSANDATRDVVLLLAQLGHPNLARMRDAGMVEGDIYVAEDHVEGVPLAELLAHGYLSGDVTLHVLAAVASSLAEAEQMVAGQQPLAMTMSVRVPDPSEIFVSSVGQVRLSLLSVMALPSVLDTVLEIESTMAAAAAAQAVGRPAARRQLPLRDPAAGIGALVERLLGPPQDREDEAAVAARQLAELAQEGSGRPGDCRALHALAISALRQVTSTTGFVSSKLADLVEHFAPLSGTDELEWAQKGAVLVEALPEDVPQAGAVQSWYHSATTPGGGRAGASAASAATGTSSGGRTGGHSPAGSHQLGQELLGTPYRLLRKLGVGGMGLVFEAEHVDLGRRVAIKVLHGALNRDPQVLARFRQEARSAARIRHPHIVEIYDFGSTTAGEVFLAMELLEGQNLTRLCQSGLLPVERAVEVLRQAAEGVEAAHQAGVIHRDLKPDNIMVVPRNRPTGARWPDLVKVLDFGIAKLRAADGSATGQPSITRQGQLFGTPEYMAPEQILGAPTDHRVDIYALGCIAYEVLCGTLPYGGDSYGKILAAHLKDVPEPLRQRAPERRIPAALDEIVLRAIAKDPEDRFASMAELADALGDVLIDISALPGLQRSTPSGLSLRSLPAAVLSTPAQPPESAVSARLSEGVRQRPRPIWHNHWLWGCMGAFLGLLGVSLWISYQQTPPGDEGAASHAGAGPSSMPRRLQRAGPAQPPTQSLQAPPAALPAPAQAAQLSTSAAGQWPPPVGSPGGPLPVSSRQPAPQAEPVQAAQAKPGVHLAAKTPQPPLADGHADAEGHSSAARSATNSSAPIGPLLAAQPPSLMVAPSVPGAQVGSDPTPAEPPLPAPEGPANAPAQPDKAQPDKPAQPDKAQPDKAQPDKPDKAQPDKADKPDKAQPDKPDKAHATPAAPAATPATPAATAPARFTGGKLSYSVASTTSAYGRRDVIAGLDSHRRALEACYQQSVRAAPLAPPRGQGSISFSIDEDGLASGRTGAEGAAREIRECVEQVLHRTRFPRPEIGPAQVTLWLSLEPISQ